MFTIRHDRQCKRVAISPYIAMTTFQIQLKCKSVQTQNIYKKITGMGLVRIKHVMPGFAN